MANSSSLPSTVVQDQANYNLYFLNQREQKIFQQIDSTKFHFKVTSVQNYEGQIPKAAYLLHEGVIQFKKRGRVICEIVKDGIFFGGNHTFYKIPLNFRIVFIAGCIVSIFTDSGIRELLRRPEGRRVWYDMYGDSITSISGALASSKNSMKKNFSSKENLNNL